MFGLFFRERPVTSYRDATACDVEAFKRFFHAMLAAGEYLAPSAYEAGFVSTAHSEALVDATVERAALAFRAGRG
jgi:glutamate-1-semialdehyde 2,1-aminomutase